MVSKLSTSALRTLRRVFVDFDCCPMPRPVETEAELRTLEELAYHDLRPEFRDEFVLLERRVLDRARAPRTLGGREVTGQVLASLLRRYTQALASRTVRRCGVAVPVA